MGMHRSLVYYRRFLRGDMLKQALRRLLFGQRNQRLGSAIQCASQRLRLCKEPPLLVLRQHCLQLAREHGQPFQYLLKATDSLISSRDSTDL